MPGYPGKITRDNLGPTFVNEVKVTNPTKEADADTFNLLCWQVAGMNGPAARGFNLCTQAGTANPVVVAQWFAWDPNQALAAVTWVRTSAGLYTYVLPNAGNGVGIYTDAKGNLVPAQLIAAFPVVQGLTNLNAVNNTNANGNSGTISIFLANTGAATDASTFVVWFI